MCQEITIFSTKIELYTFMNQLGMLILIIFNMIYLSRNNYKPGVMGRIFILSKTKEKTLLNKLKNEKFCTYFEIFILTVFQVLPLLSFNEMFGKLVTEGSTNYFGAAYAFPFFFMPLCALIGVRPIETFDKITVSYPLMLFFAKLGCFFHGCCSGIKTEYGLYNQNYEDVMFPSQLLEAAFALILFFFLLWYCKKAKKGTVFPVYLILYSTTRFFCEFLRIERNVIGMLKVYHILCIIGAALGLIQLILALKYSERITLFLDKKFNEAEQKYSAKYKAKNNPHTYAKKKR